MKPVGGDPFFSDQNRGLQGQGADILCLLELFFFLIFFLLDVTSGWLACFEFYPCGWNSICAVDKFMSNHAWCLCEIGTDKDGNCIGKAPIS